MQQDYSHMAPVSKPSSRRRNIGFLYIIPSGLVIGFLVFSGVQVFKNLTGSPVIVSSTPTPMPEREIVVATPTMIAPTDEQTKESDIAILVLNGSGKRGVAAALKEELEDEGYSNVRIGNAEKTTYTDISLRTTDDDAKEVERLKRVLERAHTVGTITEVASVSAGIAIEVIVGKED